MTLLREDPIPDHPGKRHVVELLDSFVHEGPNESHVCLVTEPLGRQVETVLSGLYLDNPAPHSLCRILSIQALQALDYLHQKNIMHGDVHTGNLVFRLTYDIDNDTETDIKAKNTRGNELNDPDDPSTLDDRTSITTGDTDANVVLVDLGASSILADSPSNSYAYPIPYRAPEVVMDTGSVTSKADIWALGCVIWRIITGIPLFAPEGWGDMDATNVEQIVMFVERLGPVPETLREAWLDSDNHLTPDGHLKNPFLKKKGSSRLQKKSWSISLKVWGRTRFQHLLNFWGLYFASTRVSGDLRRNFFGIDGLRIGHRIGLGAVILLSLDT
ncbi:hypothetical protein N7468_005791 [Penicillium chermesinum]|uniref:Protein kinase domain-containing protein n=1 Tax=Penicillium chermesinum TaxID=63820 RepID=A0A9W9P035_9EURO|nr:uncharacterized protein N7468_005791 [Penicillium chermesinum]KAJ5232835.1 hypothetical protein N7468_005791 [Penicillium chermesinum]